MSFSKLIALVLLKFLSCQPLDKSNKKNGGSNDNRYLADPKNSSVTNSFPEKYDSAIAFDYLEDPNINPLIDSVGKVRCIFKQRRLLNVEEVKNLQNMLADTSSFDGDSPKCFWPNLAVVFYSNGKVLDHLEISLMCNQLLSSFEVSGLMGRSFPKAGFSENGRTRVYELCRKLQFKQAMNKREWCEIRPIK